MHQLQKRQPNVPAESRPPDTITFRELLTPEECLEYLRLRHTVYCGEGYLTPNGLEVDLDPFDRTSRFVGAFDELGRLVGGGRMILPGPSPLASSIDALASAGLVPTLAPPTRTYNYEHAFDLKAILTHCLTTGRQLVELGRTVVDPARRSTGLGLKIVYALYGLALHHGIELGFAAIPPRLQGFYAKADCRVLSWKGIGHCAGVNSESTAVVVDLSHLSGDFRIAYRARRHFDRYGGWQVCAHERCLREHCHHPRLRPRAKPRAEKLPSIAVHGWEPALTRLPMLRPGLQLHDATLDAGLASASVPHPDFEPRLRLLDWMTRLGIGSASLGQPGIAGRNADTTRRLLDALPSTQLRLSCSGRDLCDLRAIASLTQRTGVALEAAFCIATGPLHLACSGREPKQLFDLTREAVATLVSEGLAVTLTAEDASRTSPEVLETLFRTALDAGATALCLCDTAGHASNEGTASLVGFARELRRKGGYRARIEWQGANDRGLALSNALAAIEAGADQVHASLLGVGERAGGAAMERLLLQLHRLSGRNLPLPDLQGYLEWGHDQLNLPLPPELRRLLRDSKTDEEVTHERSVA